MSNEQRAAPPNLLIVGWRRQTDGVYQSTPPAEFEAKEWDALVYASQAERVIASALAAAPQSPAAQGKEEQKS